MIEHQQIGRVCVDICVDPCHYMFVDYGFHSYLITIEFYTLWLSNAFGIQNLEFLDVQIIQCDMKQIILDEFLLVYLIGRRGNDHVL